MKVTRSSPCQSCLLHACISHSLAVHRVDPFPNRNGMKWDEHLLLRNTALQQGDVLPGVSVLPVAEQDGVPKDD